MNLHGGRGACTVARLAHPADMGTDQLSRERLGARHGTALERELGGLIEAREIARFPLSCYCHQESPTRKCELLVVQRVWPPGRSTMKNALHAFAILCIALSPLQARARVVAIDLFNFDNTSGYTPAAGVIADKNGNLFGTTSFGGSGQCSCGTVYELSPPSGNGSWTLSVPYTFQGGSDGGYPGSPLVLGRNGSLYGYTSFKSYGTVFALTPPGGGNGNWTFQVLYDFSNGSDGNLQTVSSRS